MRWWTRCSEPTRQLLARQAGQYQQQMGAGYYELSAPYAWPTDVRMRAALCLAYLTLVEDLAVPTQAPPP